MGELDGMTKQLVKPKPLPKRTTGLAAWRVMHSALDTDDAQLLLDVLGLDVKDARYGRTVQRRRGMA